MPTWPPIISASHPTGASRIRYGRLKSRLGPGSGVENESRAVGDDLDIIHGSQSLGVRVPTDVVGRDCNGERN